MRSSLSNRALLLALAVAAAAACSASNETPGGSGGSSASSGAAGGAPSGQTLVIEPADAVIDAAQGKPAAVAYAAKLVTPDSMTDVTADAIFAIDDEQLGAFQGASFQPTGVAGKAKVTAEARGLDAETTVEIRKTTVILAPGAPADAPGKFGGPVDPGASPSLVYPADGTLVPPNMGVLDFQFLPGDGNSLFELSFSGPGVAIKVYTPCNKLGAGCVYTPDKQAWTALAEAGRGKDPLTVQVRGVGDGGGVGVSATQALGFGEEDIVGGLYYWNAGAGTTMRYEFGTSGQKAELYMNAPTAGAGTCIGCHVLSRDGKKIAIGMDIPSPAPYKVFDVATKATTYAQGTLFDGQGSNFFSFSPDASQIMTSNGISIMLRDATTGAAIFDEPLVPSGSMPDWSPDGKRMVYARPAMPPPCFPPFCGAPGVDSASLEVIENQGGMWTAPTVLVPFQGQNNFYPAFSPEGGIVLFNRSPSNANSFDAMDAKVWAVATEGGAPIELAKASTGGDSWPKWVPNVQKYKGGTLLWLTFSSRRSYGLGVGGGQAQIWMTAFDPARAKAGQDPSYPAFWLPFQDPASGNHIAQWVTKIERKPCFDPSECEGGEICKDGVCEPDVPK